MKIAQFGPLAVDFVTNVFERTFRDVLRPGSIRSRVDGHRFPFAKVVLLVNNVNSRAEVESYVMPLLASGEITEFHYVEDLLDDALSRAGLTRQEIEKTIHYTDCALVAVCLPGSPYLMYSDADVFMQSPVDWISPSLQLIETDDRIAVANPNWDHSSLPTEAREFQGEFGIGYGFSDQLYLICRAEFANPIYNHYAPISWRYPFSHITPIFEQRVDAYMRSHGRQRATYTGGTYIHAAEEGATYKKVTLATRLKRPAMMATMKVLSKLPGHDPRFHM